MYIHSYIHTCIDTSVHTYTHTDIQTCIHTHVVQHVCVCVPRFVGFDPAFSHSSKHDIVPHHGKTGCFRRYLARQGALLSTVWLRTRISKRFPMWQAVDFAVESRSSGPLVSIEWAAALTQTQISFPGLVGHWKKRERERERYTTNMSEDVPLRIRMSDNMPHATWNATYETDRIPDRCQKICTAGGYAS